jgi:hypothetical protein
MKIIARQGLTKISGYSKAIPAYSAEKKLSISLSNSRIKERLRHI